MQIPLPGSRYWRSFSTNFQNLPSLNDNYKGQNEIEIQRNEKKSPFRRTPNSGPEFDLALRIINDKSFAVHLPDELENPHPFIIKAANGRAKDFFLRTGAAADPIFKLDAADHSMPALLIFLDVLIKLLVFRGYDIRINTAADGICCSKGEIKVTVMLREGFRKVISKNSNRKWSSEYTGQFIARIDNGSIRKEWREVNILKESSLARMAAIIELLGMQKSQNSQSDVK